MKIHTSGRRSARKETREMYKTTTRVLTRPRESSRENTHRRRSNKPRRSGRPSLIMRPRTTSTTSASTRRRINRARASSRDLRGRGDEEALEREKRHIHAEQTHQTPYRCARRRLRSRRRMTPLRRSRVAKANIWKSMPIQEGLTTSM